MLVIKIFLQSKRLLGSLNPFLCLVTLLTLLLVGCAGQSGNIGVAPIDEREQPPSQSLRIHLVTGGDTLYSIAFRYERDFRELATINDLDSNYVIHPGQRIYLTAEAARDAGIVASGQEVSSVSTARPVVPQDQGRAVSVLTPAPTLTSAPSVAAAPNQAQTSASAPLVLPALAPVVASDWVWPQIGPIVRSFGSGDPVSKGIQISADEGSSVVAAIDGVVVYAGAGLRGYGNLLIVKHDEEHLSAYAYNRELLAQEGDIVRAGQQIATVGADAEGNNRLYFEIRLDGTPVDPIRYLPRR